MVQPSPYQVKRSPLVKIVIWTVVAVLVYVGVTYTIPFFNAYDVRTAMKTACVDYVRESRSKAYEDYSAAWRPKFLSAVRAKGVELTDDQYSFEITDELNDVVCTAKTAFALETDWPGSWLVTGKKRTIRTVHKPKVVYKWKRRF